MKIRPEDALEYHSSSPAGKLSVIPTKPCRTQRDLSLAYTPGVAVPCLEIERDPSLAYKYTAKGNLVGVVSNGTAVLGLGNIGALAGKPVMEGKAVLFKRFADIDVFDIELDTKDPEEIIRTCQILEPTFGGINLEDIRAPECFYIEETLRKTMKIPVFHDDQHGTAIISGAGLINALELGGKKIEDIKVVFNGAGAAAISCAAHYVRLGVRLENIVMCDTKGVIFRGPHRAHESVQGAVCLEDERAHAAGSDGGRGRLLRAFAGGLRDAGHGAGHGARPDHLRDGEPGSGDHLRGCKGRAARRHRGHRTQRLSQPGEQRSGLPVYFPRGAGCARDDDQRRNEAGGDAGAGFAGQGRRAGQRAARLLDRPPEVRAGVHYSEALRPARADLGGVGGGAGRHGNRCGAAAGGLEAVSRGTGKAAWARPPK